MQVAELATDLGVSPSVLLSLLRSLRISATGEGAPISEGDVALILARLERERRSGHVSTSDAIEAAIVDANPSAGKRRRRPKSELPPEPEPEAAEVVDSTEDVEPAEEVEVVASAADTEEEVAEAVEPEPVEPEAVEPEPVAADVDDEAAPELDVDAGMEEPAVDVQPEAQAEEEAEAEAPGAASLEPDAEAPPRNALSRHDTLRPRDQPG
jgi:hypothetical protein